MFEFAPLRQTSPKWARKLISKFADLDPALDEVGYTEFDVVRDDETVLETTGRIAWLREIVFPLPALDSVSVALLAEHGITEVAFAHRRHPDFEYRLFNLQAALRLKSELLRRVHQDISGKWVPELDLQGKPKPAEIVVSGAEVVLAGDWNISIIGQPALSLPAVMLGNSGIVLEVTGVGLYLSDKQPPPPGAQPGFRGVAINSASLHFTGPIAVHGVPDAVILADLLIGSSGFSGKVTATWTPANGSGTLLGCPFTIESLMVELKQDIPVESSLKGLMVLPFFDEPAEVEVNLAVDGSFHVSLAGTGPDGLKTLTKPNVLEMELDSIGFDVADDVFTMGLSGKLTPLFGGLTWPTFDVKELSIDSKGHVHLDGGWLKLPEQKTFDFYGFKIEITQLGFGSTDDGGKWIGFSGGIHLVDGLPQGASVEGLRITWYEDGRPAKITLNGAGVELLIPDVLYFKGSVSYREIADGANTIHRFDGDIKLQLATPELEIDGTIVIGSVNGPQGRYNFFAIYVDAELPTGIPLAATGLGFYGFAGLFALQMEPNKKPEEMWFSIDHSKSFYHRDTPGITDLKNKWGPQKGSFALGAGITLGTLADNGYSFYGKFLLAIVIPGPIIMLQGAASFLKKQKDANDEGQFRALAVLDGRAGSLLIGLDAEYKTGKGGELIEIGGSMEAFYAFHDATAWHLWLGKDEPRSLRIRALFGHFVEANAYFMLDAHALALGAWYGYNHAWKFGPLRVRLEAWAEGNAKLSFKPIHFHGDLSIHCLVDLSAFGIGLGISLDALIAADLFRPYHLLGTFSVGIKVPFKKKKIGATVRLEWGPRMIAPPLPLPVKQIAVESLKSTVKWLLPRGQYLLPNWDDGEGFLSVPPGGPTLPDLTTVPPHIPLVPLDARLSVTFGRSVQDKALAGVNPQPAMPEEIGAPGRAVATVTYALESLALSRWDGASWQTVAMSPKTGTIPALFGSWMPGPKLPDSSPGPGQTKLLVWSKSPFDFTRATGSSWEEWVSDGLPDYPCIPLLPAQETCFGFGELKPGTALKSPWTHTGPPAFTLSWGFGPATVVERTLGAEGALRPVNVLCFSAETMRRGVHIRPTPTQPERSFRILFAPAATVVPAPGPVPSPVPSPAPHPAASAAAEPTPAATSAVTAPPVALAVFTFGAPAATCVDVRGHAAGTLANPWSDGDVRFTVFGADGLLLPQARVERWGVSPLGLNAGFQLDIELPCTSPWVELIITHRPPFRIIAFNEAGAAVATHAPFGTGAEATETIRLEGPEIKRVEVHATGNEKLVHSVCYLCTRPAGPSATGYDAHGHAYGPFFPIGNEIDGKGAEIIDVVVTADSGQCIQMICMTPDPEAGQAVRREELIQHVEEELARWHDEEPVLAPNTTYRLTVTTLVHPTPIANISFSGDVTPVEHAYFRTEGPPGLTKLLPPDGVSPDNFDSGLDDLVRYVHETDPPTVPPPGEKPILYRPFYRAYDLGVEFNEDYVEQMYRMDQRDLGLYLFDNNNQPARDTLGRLLVLGNRWGKAETLTLSDKDTHWVTLVNTATCLQNKLDPQTFVHASALASSDPDRVLAPDTLHEARLVPLLLHEAFAGASLGVTPPGWFVDDAGSGGPSRWQVGDAGDPPSYFAEQVSAIGDPGADRAGTLLLLADPSQLPAGDPGRPSQWTDYRVSVYARSATGGAVGFVVRQQGLGSGYRFSLDGRVRRLVKMASGVTTLLAEDHFAYRKNRDYRLTVEVLGTSIKAYLDGEPVFDVVDSDYDRGRIGLYTCQAAGASFSDVVVDDLRRGAPAVYRYQLTTSLYANFFHHLHSFQDETWKASLAADPTVDAMLSESVAPSFTPPDEKEARAFEELATKVLGPAARQNSAQVEVTRVDRDGGSPIFLLRSPEPIDPTRTELALSQSGRTVPPGVAPGTLKLTDVSLGANRPEDEAVTLLLRDAADLTRQRIELRQLPGPLSEMVGDPVLLLESFLDQTSLGRFTIVDAPDAGGSSLWQIESGGLVEVSGVGGGNEPELPGTHAMAGDSEWTDYRLTVDLRADAGGEIGLLLRYADESNYYRLSLGATLSYRRLVKCVQGETTILWEDGQGYSAGEPFRLTIEAVGPRLVGFVDEAQVFDLRDDALAAGLVGVYASANLGARCDRIEVRQPLIEGRTLLNDRFAEGQLTDWSLLPEATNVASSVAWGISGGALHLDHLVAAGSDPAYPGAYAATGDPAWTDAILQVRMRSGGGAIGVVVRATDTDNYYRFSMSRDFSYRQLVKKVAGTLTVLWRDAVAYEANRTYELTVIAIGSSLRGYADGVPLFSIQDADLPAGRIALYSWSNQDAWFSDVRVWPGDQAFDRWLVDDSFATLVPDRWRFIDDAERSEPERWTVDGSLHPAVTPAPGGVIAIGTPVGRQRPSSPPDQFHYALLTPPMDELRLAVRLELDANGAAGVVFGWQDAANHLAFWLDAQRDVRRLLRTHASAIEVLWEDAVRPDSGRQYLVTIDQMDGRLVGHLDGVQIFSIDAAPAIGAAGLALRDGASARFDELRLAAPEWTCWYESGEEERLPAGTQVRVHAAPAIASPPNAGLLLRSVALAGERGRLRLPGNGAALRIVGSDGQPGHTRTFIPNDAFAPLAIRRLGKADGTAFFIIPASTQPATGGSLRLDLTYYRDRPEAGRPMSQAGDRTPEHVAIEFGE